MTVTKKEIDILKPSRLGIVLIITFLLLLILTGCGNEKENLKSRIDDYYKVIASQKYEPKHLEGFYNPKGRYSPHEIAVAQANAYKVHYTNNPLNRKFGSYVIQYILMNERQDQAIITIDLRDYMGTQDNPMEKLAWDNRIESHWCKVNGTWYIDDF